MSATQLLAALAALDDSSETIKRFRRLVVGLAVSGKLEPPSTVSAGSGTHSDLTRGSRVRPEDESVRSPEKAAVLSEKDLPRSLPRGERFVRLGTVARIEKGKTGIAKANPGPYPLVVTAEDRLSCDHYDFSGAAAIVPLVSSAGHGKASIQRLHYQEGEFALGSILAAIFPLDPTQLSPRFLFEYLSAFKDDLLVSRMIGTANVSLSVSKIAEVPVPLLSSLVQNRVDELMALCDRLEAARAEREAARDRLTVASLARLNSPDPETFRQDARFVLDALPALSARVDQVKQIRQTILNLAVRGKLVKQDPGDEPADKLLARIARKKSALPDGRNARGRASLGRTQVAREEVALPPGWTLTTLGDVALKITDGAHKTPTYVSSGVPFVSVKDFSAGRLNLANTRFISPEEHRSLYKRCDPRRGDILIGRIGTLGCAVLVDVDVEFSLFVSVGLIRFSHEEILPEFFRRLLNSPFVAEEFDRIKVGGGTHTNKLNLGDLHGVALPIPPLAEQHRIVAKVDELMAICDRLEASLVEADDTRGRLLEALLADALGEAAIGDVAA